MFGQIMKLSQYVRSWRLNSTSLHDRAITATMKSCITTHISLYRIIEVDCQAVFFLSLCLQGEFSHNNQVCGLYTDPFHNQQSQELCAPDQLIPGIKLTAG